MHRKFSGRRNAHFFGQALDGSIKRLLYFLILTLFVLNPETAAAEKLPLSFKNKGGLTMRLVPEGVYLLGSPPEEAGRYLDEGPQHKVALSAFYISEKEITNAQYGQFLDATGRTPPLYWLDKNLNAPQQPVVGVTWHDAAAFATWLSALTGARYRLPTEAEWEAACRGGLTGKAFPWGNQLPEQNGRFLANYNPNPYDKDGFWYAAPTGSFPSNLYGLFDMSGNVAEWCGDWYAADYYSHSPHTNPEGPASGTYRVIRGGSWYARARELRCGGRQFFRPSRADGFIGFRVVHPIAP